MNKKIGIITTQPHYEEVEALNLIRFPEEFEKRGYEVNLFFYDKFFIGLGKNGPFLFYNEKKFDPKEYVLFVINACNSRQDSDFLFETLESTGAVMKNTYRSILVAKNKLRTYLFLSKAGVPILPSAVNFSQYFLGALLDYFEDEKYVCKLACGSLGKGVGILESKISLISMLELLASKEIAPSEIMFEKYISEAAGRDIRIIATPKRVIAAMERRSQGFDFRANIFSGGSGHNKKLSQKMEKIAIDSIRALGLDYGGVDILETNKGPVVIEVNANPGLKIEEQLKINVAGEIVDVLLSGINEQAD